MNHVYLPAVHTQNACRLKLVGVLPQNTPLQKQPRASRHQLVGVLKLSGQCATSSRIFANVWRIRDGFAKVDGPPRQFPDMRPAGPLACS